jgi:imidazolonepropionase-like amidohydrolase
MKPSLLPAAALLVLLVAGGNPARAEGDAAGGAPPPPRVRPGDGVTALVGGDVYTISGPVFRRGTVLVRDGKIWKVGVDLPIPEGARVLDVAGRRVLPGWVAPDAEPLALVPGTPKPGGLFRDSLDPYSRMNEVALGTGLTAYYVTSTQGRGFSTTLTAVLRPAPGDAARMVLKEPAALWVNYVRGPVSDRMAFEEQLRAGARHIREADEALRAKREAPRPPVPAEILAVLRREIPVRVPAERKDEILDALRLAEVHGVKLVIEDALESWLVAEPIARAGATALVTPRRRFRDPRIVGPHGGSIEVAAVLERAGARFGLVPPGAMGDSGGGMRLAGLAGRDLAHYFVEGAFAVRGGASEEAVLRSMTLGAAEALGVADRIGSIDPGKDADLIVLDGDPLHYRTVVETALVEGKVLYERSKSPLFRHLPGR